MTAQGHRARTVVLTTALLAGLLAGCTKPALPPAPTPEPTPQPSATLQTMFKDCTWGVVSAAGVSIGSFTCPTQRLVADEALPGFQMERTDGARVTRAPVIRIFKKAPDAAIDAILPAVRLASPGSDTASCGLQPVAAKPGRYQLMPTGKAQEAYAQFVAGKADGPSLPCGALGPSEAGERLFLEVKGAPGTIVSVDLGSDPQIYDPATIQAQH